MPPLGTTTVAASPSLVAAGSARTSAALATTSGPTDKRLITPTLRRGISVRFHRAIYRAHAGGAGLCPAGAQKRVAKTLRKRSGLMGGTLGSPVLYQPRVSSSSSGDSDAAAR